jgi:hypothetical protein
MNGLSNRLFAIRANHCPAAVSSVQRLWPVANLNISTIEKSDFFTASHYFWVAF